MYIPPDYAFMMVRPFRRDIQTSKQVKNYKTSSNASVSGKFSGAGGNGRLSAANQRPKWPFKGPESNNVNQKQE
jgi:hypothetical protein